MHLTNQMEQFSLAYIHAVASAAGYSLSDPRVDYQSIDVAIDGFSETGVVCDPSIKIQAKCTAQENLVSDDCIRFRLKSKNYEELRRYAAVARLLVVIIVPKDTQDWLQQSEQELVMRKCAYWKCLYNMPPENQEEITVQIPRANIFSVTTLQALINEIAVEGHLNVYKSRNSGS